jgi:hypothetical protein
MFLSLCLFTKWKDTASSETEHEHKNVCQDQGCVFCLKTTANLGHMNLCHIKAGQLLLLCNGWYHGNADTLQAPTYRSATLETVSALHQASASTERSNRVHIMGRESHMLLAVSFAMSGLSSVVNSTVCVCVWFLKLSGNEIISVLLGYDRKG